MIVDSMTEAIDLGEVFRKSEKRILVVKIINGFVDRRGDLKEKSVINEFDEVVERNLVKSLTRRKIHDKLQKRTVAFMSLFRAIFLVSSALSKSLTAINCWRAVLASSAWAMKSASVRMLSGVMDTEDMGEDSGFI